MEGLLARYPGVLIVMLGLSILEFVWLKRQGDDRYDIKTAGASLGVAIGQFAIKPLTGGLIFGVYLALYDHAPFEFALNDWRAWVGCFVALEFAYYWMHRWSHTVKWLWATHVVHHSSNQIILPVAIRLGWTGALSGGWLVFAPLALMGFPPQLIIAMLAINLFYQFGLHTEAVRKLGVLEWVLNTPSHHRAHHACDPAFLDCNFGGVLIIFDRLFGTFRAEPDEGGLTYGLVSGMQSYNPFTIALHYWGVIWRDVCQSKNVAQFWQAVAGRP
jgi:sterol desaturase/sphingolipid hydroxylase (fatty acid hydroxylase superfamily)